MTLNIPRDAGVNAWPPLVFILDRDEPALMLRTAYSGVTCRMVNSTEYPSSEPSGLVAPMDTLPARFSSVMMDGRDRYLILPSFSNRPIIILALSIGGWTSIALTMVAICLI